MIQALRKQWEYVRLGMIFALDMLFLDLIVESDALVVIEALKNGGPAMSLLSSVIDDCKQFEPCFHNLMYSHVGRMGNQAAHGLAKHVLSHQDTVWLEEVPPPISSCIFADRFPPSTSY